MAIEKISIEKAKKDKLFYFVATAVVYRESDGRCLILKRSDREIVHPGKYAALGGKLEWNDLDFSKATTRRDDIVAFEGAVEKLLKREIFEEAGIQVKDAIHYLGSFALVRPDEVPVVLMRFITKYKEGDVKIEEHSFTDFAWVNAEEILKYDCIGNVKDEVVAAIDHFKK